MNKLSLKDLDKLKINRYEAVIIASQHARLLNTKRIADLEKLEENPEHNFETRKITMVALKELLNGTLKFGRRGSI